MNLLVITSNFIYHMWFYL